MPSLYLVRHASPDWNRKDIPYHLPPGPPLSEQGHAEARALGQFLRLANVQQLWTSPLERCLHTAEIVAGITGAAVAVNSELREWQPQESKDALRARTLPVVEQAWQWAVRQNGADGAIALVTHGGPIMTLLSALGIDDRTMETLRIYDHRNPVPPAGVWEVTRPALPQAWEMQLVFTPETVAA
jgi:broad specificity phosphatase PhoE